MKKTVPLVILLAIVFSAIGIAAPPPALALPCCDGWGYHLCDPESPWWEYPEWGLSINGRHITISSYQCRDFWCGDEILHPLPQINGLNIGDDAAGSLQCVNTTIVQNSARKFCQQKSKSPRDDYLSYELQGLAGGNYTYYDNGAWRTDKSIYCYITNLRCLGSGIGP